jgi:tetraacyldisaccharide 4'-kinase
MKKNTARRSPLTAHCLLLLPFSFIYGVAVAIRRKIFLHSKTFVVPTICVGNLRVGGTGKTPFVEYLAKFLLQKYKIAILSRGYGRKTKGFIHANETLNVNAKMIGDEPIQYVQNFQNVDLAVCEKRKTGIQKLLQKNPELEVIILDDAYQHLSVNYSLRIILTEYDRPYFNDYPLPSGRLRECRTAAKYADMIFVTKCPENLTNDEKEVFLQKLKPQEYQEVFFTKIGYEVSGVRCEVSGELEEAQKAEGKKRKAETVLLITGIDNPAPLVKYLESQYEMVHKLHFKDHHSFTEKDINKIIYLKEKLGGENCTLITTEKDATRLHVLENIPEYQTISIKISFLEKETLFKEKLLSLLHLKDA